MSKLLISESPIMILPSLAVRVGVNEAVLLQQVHYWLVKSSHVKEGRTWIYKRTEIGKSSCRFGQRARLSER
jgi:hypothetical protein